MKQLDLFNHTKPPALCEGVGTGLRETERQPHATAQPENVREMLHENVTGSALNSKRGRRPRKKGKGELEGETASDGAEASECEAKRNADEA